MARSGIAVLRNLQVSRSHGQHASSSDPQNVRAQLSADGTIRKGSLATPLVPRLQRGHPSSARAPVRRPARAKGVRPGDYVTASAAPGDVADAAEPGSADPWNAGWEPGPETQEGPTAPYIFYSGTAHAALPWRDAPTVAGDGSSRPHADAAAAWPPGGPLHSAFVRHPAGVRLARAAAGDRCRSAAAERDAAAGR